MSDQIETTLDIGSLASESPVGEAPEASEALQRRRPMFFGGYYWGTGRRKRAVARVRIRAGEGKILINKRDLDTFFALEKDRESVLSPLMAVNALKTVDVWVNVGGGGHTGQAGAIMMGLARALEAMDVNHSQVLLDGHYLTRDSRMTERKKYGQRGARRRFQFSKR